MIEDRIGTLQTLEEKLKNATWYNNDDMFIRVCSYCDNLINVYDNEPIRLSDNQREMLYTHYSQYLTHGIDLKCLDVEMTKLKKCKVYDNAKD